MAFDVCHPLCEGPVIETLDNCFVAFAVCGVWAIELVECTPDAAWIPDFFERGTTGASGRGWIADFRI